MREYFKVIVPAEISKAKDGLFKIRGLASTSDVDRQGEILLPSGIDMSPIDDGRGILNWNHSNKPEDIVGTLDSYSKTEKGLYIEGRLFKNHTRAKAIQEIMSSLGDNDKHRMGLSVEGHILKRNSEDDKIIEQCVISGTALTMSPVNQQTHCSLIKSMNSDDLNLTFEKPNEKTYTSEEVLDLLTKALGIGAGSLAAPDTRSGGDALVVEDFGSKTKKKKKRTLEKHIKYEEGIREVLQKLQALYPESTREDIWEALKLRISHLTNDDR